MFPKENMTRDSKTFKLKDHNICTPYFEFHNVESNRVEIEAQALSIHVVKIEQNNTAKNFERLIIKTCTI